MPARSSTAHPSQAGASAPPVRRGPMLVVLLSAWFLAQFDFFAVNVAAPSLEAEIHATPVALEFIVGGYAFTYAAGMITGGRLGDLFGYRRLFVIGTIAFTLASLLCGIAPGSTQLVLARLLQGLAAAVMVPQVLALITATFPARTRPRALGWYGAAGGLGSIMGQVLGGLLLDADVLGLGWRIIFLLNLPLGVLTAALAAWLLPRLERTRDAHLDPLGAAGIAATLALVLVPLALGPGQGWPVWTWICMAATLPVAALIGRWQQILTSRGGQPVLDLSLFRLPSYVACCTAGIAFTAYFASFMFTLALLFQSGLGLTAFEAGLAFAPMGVLFSITALLGSRLVGRHGLSIVMFGGSITSAALLLLVLRLSMTNGHPGLPWVITSLVLAGLGNGFVLPQLIGAALVDVQPHQAGIGAAILTTSQQFAQSAGVAIIGTVFFAAAGDLPTGADYAHAMARSALINIGLILTVIALTAYNKRISRHAEKAE